MSRSKYTPNNSKIDGMGAYLAKDAGLQSALVSIAEAGKSYAESIAPVDTGDYASSFHTSRESFRPDSVGATIFNDAPHAPLVEYARSHTLAKTADHLNASMRRGQ